jgi:hypothetical protein
MRHQTGRARAVIGTPHRERGTYPLYPAVADFSR